MCRVEQYTLYSLVELDAVHLYSNKKYRALVEVLPHLIKAFTGLGVFIST